MIRSLLAAIKIRKDNCIKATNASLDYGRAEFTKQMFDNGYTILAPQMSPIHFDIVEPVFEKYGFKIEVLKNDDRNCIDVGLKYVNNDACFPSITVVGQIMSAVLSGKYDTNRLAVIMTQTGGCCRASNYIAFIRRALDKVGMSHIPVISLNTNGMEKNEGFKIPPMMVYDLVKSVVYGDLLMRCLYRVRPYEKIKHSANVLHEQWRERCIDSLINAKSRFSHKDICQGIVKDFDNLEIDETVVKPRVGIVGEILVKYMPLANNNLVELLEREGAEAVVPDLMDFMNYSLTDAIYGKEFLGTGRMSAIYSSVGIKAIKAIRQPAIKALSESKRFEPPMDIFAIQSLAKPLLSLGNQAGEGWLLTGEMVELIKHGVPNIVCIQPFACLPNHIVGKGVLKQLKKSYPEANVVAVDYDPGASEVNQLNRIKLMLSVAKSNTDNKKAVLI